MRTLQELYKQIEEVADFTDIKISGPNTVGLFSTRPLHVAAVWGDCEAIQMLVDAGANINEKGEHGFTPLMEAVAQGHREAVVLLVKLGAKPEPNNDGQLPSEYAIVAKRSDLADYLKRNGL
jgi:ankyrin repeat protein